MDDFLLLLVAFIFFTPISNGGGPPPRLPTIDIPARFAASICSFNFHDSIKSLTSPPNILIFCEFNNNFPFRTNILPSNNTFVPGGVDKLIFFNDSYSTPVTFKIESVIVTRNIRLPPPSPCWL